MKTNSLYHAASLRFFAFAAVALSLFVAAYILLWAVNGYINLAGSSSPNTDHALNLPAEP